MTNEQLVIRIQAGDNVAEDMLQLWQQNRGYVNKIVKAYIEYGEEDDLQQEGYLGLSEAVIHYSQEEGASFITYASYWIKQKILRYIRKNSIVRLPDSIYTRIRDYNKTVSEYEKLYGKKPSEHEICYSLNISKKMLENTKKASLMAKIESLDVPIGDEEDGSLYDLLPNSGDEEEDILSKIQHEELSAILWPMVDSLPERQSETLRARYQQNRTLKDIAQEKKVSLEMIRQYEQKGLKELRKTHRQRILRPFWEEQIYSMGLKGNGVNKFNTTWTSSTERAAIFEIDKHFGVIEDA